MEKLERFRHYGNEEWSEDKFQEPVNSDYWKIKPQGGLWASPVNSNWGWKDWCESEDFRECTTYFDFSLKPGSNVYIIDSYADLEKFKYISLNSQDNFLLSTINLCTIDFEAAKLEYDAILLTDLGQSVTRLTHPFTLYGWDCESLLVLRKESICDVENRIHEP